MSSSAKPRQSKLSTLDQDIERFRKRLIGLKAFIMGEETGKSIEEFDFETEELIMEVFGSSSPMLEAYEYSELGEAGGLVNLTEEAPEGMELDGGRESLRQRQRVLESCVGDLEARRAEASKKNRPPITVGPKVLDFMSKTIQSIPMDATLKEAGRLLQEYKIGSLLVQGGDEFIGSITETELSREVVARGVDPSTTTVKTCMREPVLTIESSAPVIEAVKLMKEKATRHVAVTDSGQIIGIVSVSDVLRYYSGVV